MTETRCRTRHGHGARLIADSSSNSPPRLARLLPHRPHDGQRHGYEPPRVRFTERATGNVTRDEVGRTDTHARQGERDEHVRFRPGLGR
jgi:hypothetical protein